MAKFSHRDAVDNPNLYKTNSQRIALLKGYAKGDSYATAVSNIAGVTTVATGDFTFGNLNTYDRKITVAAKSVVLTVAVANGVNDLHVALLDDTNSKVLYVANETSDSSGAIGQTFNIPTFDINLIAAT